MTDGWLVVSPLLAWMVIMALVGLGLILYGVLHHDDL